MKWSNVFIFVICHSFTPGRALWISVAFPFGSKSLTFRALWHIPTIYGQYFVWSDFMSNSSQSISHRISSTASRSTWNCLLIRLRWVMVPDLISPVRLCSVHLSHTQGEWLIYVRVENALYKAELMLLVRNRCEIKLMKKITTLNQQPWFHLKHNLTTGNHKPLTQLI